MEQTTTKDTGGERESYFTKSATMETLEARHHRAYLGKPELVEAVHVRHSVISDHRIGQAEHLPCEGWVRQGLGVSDHAGRENLPAYANGVRKSEGYRHGRHGSRVPAERILLRCARTHQFATD